MKKIIIIAILICIIIILTFFPIISTVVVSIGYNNVINESLNTKNINAIVNNQIYAERYKKLLNNNLITKGYVSLERLIFYLQRTHNVLDITSLSDDEWLKAYIENLNSFSKQMIPIKTICTNLKNNKELPEFTISSNINEDGLYIEVINLCEQDGVDITESNDFSNDYPLLFFLFPLKDNFSITSMFFENRDIELNLSASMKENTDFHEAWDFAVPIGTDFYSICDGTIVEIVNTQFNDLGYNFSNNSIGNYVKVKCDNELIVGYLHIKANSVPIHYKVGSHINQGALLGKTSNTGISTGPHLHLELKNIDGEYLDALEFIDFDYTKG